MAIGFFKGGRDEDALLADINTTPLVDVMLVLLIIFLITIPAVHTSVAVSLPRQANQVRETRPETSSSRWMPPAPPIGATSACPTHAPCRSGCRPLRT